MIKEELLKAAIQVILPENRLFLRIKETLTRIGVIKSGDKPGDTPILSQICHILFNKGKYYILHFRELIALNTPTIPFSIRELDAHRRDQIAGLLATWGMIKIVHPDRLAPFVAGNMYGMHVIKFADAGRYRLDPNYLFEKRPALEMAS